MLRYRGPFLFLASIPLLYYGGGAADPLVTIASLVALQIGVEAISRRGDAGGILLALAPPPWRRVMDEKARRIAMGQA